VTCAEIGTNAGTFRAILKEDEEAVPNASDLVHYVRSEIGG
jgi:hypothetical protein